MTTKLTVCRGFTIKSFAVKTAAILPAHILIQQVGNIHKYVYC